MQWRKYSIKMPAITLRLKIVVNFNNNYLELRLLGDYHVDYNLLLLRLLLAQLEKQLKFITTQMNFDKE